MAVKTAGKWKTGIRGSFQIAYVSFMCVNTCMCSQSYSFETTVTILCSFNESIPPPGITL